MCYASLDDIGVVIYTVPDIDDYFRKKLYIVKSSGSNLLVGEYGGEFSTLNTNILDRYVGEVESYLLMLKKAQAMF